MNVDNVDKVKGNGLDPIKKPMENSMVDQTDGSDSIGLSGTATVFIARSKVSK